MSATSTSIDLTDILDGDGYLARDVALEIVHILCIPGSLVHLWWTSTDHPMFGERYVDRWFIPDAAIENSRVGAVNLGIAALARYYPEPPATMALDNLDSLTLGVEEIQQQVVEDSLTILAGGSSPETALQNLQRGLAELGAAWEHDEFIAVMLRHFSYIGMFEHDGTRLSIISAPPSEESKAAVNAVRDFVETVGRGRPHTYEGQP